MDIDTLLYNETMGLLRDTKKTVSKFLHIADQEDLRQKDWDMFWKGLREQIFENEKFDVCLNGKDIRVTRQELKYLEFNLGEAELVSNCCGEKVENEICSECGEGAKEVLSFNND